jgi:hypothetical protein
MAKQRPRQSKSKGKNPLKSSRKVRSMAARANEDAVLRRPAEMFSAPEAWLALMSKSGAAFLDLQMRSVSCRSPIDLWSEQIRFIKGRFDDTHALLKRISS